MINNNIKLSNKGCVIILTTNILNELSTLNNNNELSAN